jgi:hypothetical protein
MQRRPDEDDEASPAKKIVSLKRYREKQEPEPEPPRQFEHPKEKVFVPILPIEQYATWWHIEDAVYCLNCVLCYPVLRHMASAAEIRFLFDLKALRRVVTPVEAARLRKLTRRIDAAWELVLAEWEEAEAAAKADEGDGNPAA